VVRSWKQVLPEVESEKNCRQFIAGTEIFWQGENICKRFEPEITGKAALPQMRQMYFNSCHSQAFVLVRFSPRRSAFFNSVLIKTGRKDRWQGVIVTQACSSRTQMQRLHFAFSPSGFFILIR